MEDAKLIYFYNTAAKKTPPFPPSISLSYLQVLRLVFQTARGEEEYPVLP